MKKKRKRTAALRERTYIWCTDAPFAGMTRFRFKGSSAMLSARTSQPCGSPAICGESSRLPRGVNGDTPAHWPLPISSREPGRR